VFLIVLLTLAGTWYVGKLDPYLPKAIKSIEVLGDSAPAAAPKPAATPAAGSGSAK
jgi:hypothetical protein